MHAEEAVSSVGSLTHSGSTSPPLFIIHPAAELAAIILTSQGLLCSKSICKFLHLCIYFQVKCAQLVFIYSICSVCRESEGFCVLCTLIVLNGIAEASGIYGMMCVTKTASKMRHIRPNCVNAL